MKIQNSWHKGTLLDGTAFKLCAEMTLDGKGDFGSGIFLNKKCHQNLLKWPFSYLHMNYSTPGIKHEVTNQPYLLNYFSEGIFFLHLNCKIQE